MHDIDFLPSKYREQNTARKARVWQFAVLLLFGGVIVATAAGQYLLRVSATSERDAVLLQHTAAKATNDLFDRLQSRLADVRSTAQLYTYLQHPWPRTQILAAVGRELPDEVTLSEMRITLDANASPEGGRNRPRDPRRSENEDKELAGMHPAARDLKQLADEFNGQRTVVLLAGHTSDTAALHRLVARLGDAALFAKAELRSLEAAQRRELHGSSVFEVRLTVRPGYGQPGGPRQPSETQTQQPAPNSTAQMP